MFPQYNQNDSEEEEDSEAETEVERAERILQEWNVTLKRK
jgi:hypothetical protein